MITLNNRKLCENCFSETTIVPCPHCGFAKMSYRQDPIALAIGSVLNQRYMIGGVIGKGGFGITYLAYDLKLDARLAVKEYYPMGLAIRNPGTTIVSVSNEESQESFRTGAEKFYNEAKMVARFNGNPNIVSVHDFFYENETVYFTMGYLQGQTLKSYLKKKKVTEGQAVNVLKGISSALMASHSMNILHRDISPDNIMLCDDGSIRLLDFGAARQVMAEQSQSLSVILKQGFAPLEQYQKKGKQGPWTDIYALGATVYTALTGEMLSDPMSRLEDDSDFESNKHGISDGLWNIIRKCTQLKITDRYQNVSELKEDIKALGIEIEPFTDVDEEIMDLLRSRGGKGPGNTTPGTSADNAASSDPNATVLLSGQSEEMPADPNAGSWNSTVNMPGQPVTGGYTGQPSTGQPVTGQQAAVPPATGQPSTGQPVPGIPQSGPVPQGGPVPQQGGVPRPAGGGAVPPRNIQGGNMPAQPKKGFPIALIIIPAVIAVLFILIIGIVAIRAIFSNNDPEPTEVSTEATTEDVIESTEATEVEVTGGTDEPAPEVDASGRQDKLEALGESSIDTHTNDIYKYSICSPSDYAFMNVDNETIEIANQDGTVHIAVRYMDRYIDGSILYNSYDFANMINVRRDNLLPVEGSGSTPKTDSVDRISIAGQDEITRIEYNYKDNNGKPWNGKVYLFNSRGQYGCYVVYTLISSKADDYDDLLDYAEACVDSFRVDDVYDPPAVDIYEIEEEGIKFSLSDSEQVTQNEYGIYYILHSDGGEEREAWLTPGEKFGTDYAEIFRNIASDFGNGMSIGSEMIPIDFGEYKGYWVETSSDYGDGRMYAFSTNNGSDAAYNTYVVVGYEDDDDTLRDLVGGFRFEGATTYNNYDVDTGETIEIEADSNGDVDDFLEDINTSEYILPGSDSRELTDSDINDFLNGYLEKNNARNLSGSEKEKLCARALCYARNEIYARHGYIFKSGELRDLFESMSWYDGTIPAESFNSNIFNAAEKKNIEFLKAKMDEYGGYQPAK